ncbi:MAG: VWD domain-containing protein [Chloroflexota bacterium]
MARVGAAGEADRQAALDAFAIAFTPLPGTSAPPGEITRLHDGTLAVMWIHHFWDTLTAEQQAFADKLIRGEPPTAARAPAVIAAVAAPPAARPAPPAALPTDWKSLAAELRSIISAHLGRELEAELKTAPLESLIEVGADEWHADAWVAGQDANGEFKGKSVKCTIYIHPDALSYTGADAREVIAHEMFHCFDQDLSALADRAKMPPWVKEGAAEWAGTVLSDGKSHWAVARWQSWLKNPPFPLYARSYDAFGIFFLLQDTGVDPWEAMDDILQAARGGTEPAYQVLSGVGGEWFLNTWGSRYFMDPFATHEHWRYVGAGLNVSAPYFSIPFVPITPGTAENVSADPYAANDLSSALRADVVEIETAGGYGLVLSEVGEQTLEVAASRPFCTVPGGCVCPGYSGDFWNVSFDTVLQIGVTGHDTSVSATLVGYNLGNFCDEEPVEWCKKGCGASNGDPHLITVDGHAYDFQAVGEFTLLRSADSHFQLQVRQKAWRSSKRVSFNSAVAVGLGGDRAAVYVTTTGTRLLVNGAEVPMAEPTTAGGLSIKAIPNGLELRAIDGAIVWIMGIGPWGLNVIVDPADDLLSSGSGLLGPVPDGSSLPAMPDGSAVELGADYAAAVYGTLAPAWEVTPQISLFDYEAGESSVTFRDPSIPEPGSPHSFRELPAAQQQAGRSACASITAPALLEQCAFDVAVTGDDGFVGAYEQTEQALGPQAFEPPATPEPLPGEDACGTLSDEQILVITGLVVLNRQPGIPSSGTYTAGCYWTLETGGLDNFAEIYLNVQSPGGRAAYDEYLVTWPGLQPVAGVGDEAVLDPGINITAVVGDTLIDMQYVDVFNPDTDAVNIELARAAAEHY